MPPAASQRREGSVTQVPYWETLWGKCIPPPKTRAQRGSPLAPEKEREPWAAPAHPPSHGHPHLLQGVRWDLLAPPEDGAVVLGGEALQLGAQGLLLLRDDAKGARLGGQGGMWGSPQPAPQFPAPLRVPLAGGGGYGERQSLRACTRGGATGWGRAERHPGSPPQAESSWGGRGAHGVYPIPALQEGMLRAQGTGGGGAVLTTADMLSSVLRWPQDTGRRKKESAAVGIPTVSAAPLCPIPCSSCSRRATPTLPSTITYCLHLCLPARGSAALRNTRDV